MKKIKKMLAIGTAIAIGTTTLSACKSNLSPTLAFLFKKGQQDQKVEKVIIPCKIKDLQKDFLLKCGLKVEKWEILDDKGAEIVLFDPNSGQKIQYNCIQTSNDMTECVGKIYNK